MKKKVNLNRPQISSEEISKGKNFDSVLKTHITVSKPLYQKPWFLSSVIVTVAAVITAVVMHQQKNTLKNNESKTAEISTSADSLALAAFYKNEAARPCIHPPLKGVNIPYTTYKVIAEKGAALDFKTGSKIIIPKNVFVDENGKPLKGEVELRYREFHDAVDFFVSGIPMTYDSAGVKYQFESAGMMEMLAFQNGKQVSMAAGKSINVELASNYKGSEYNLYKLDTVKNNWSCLGKDKVTSQIAVSEEAVKGHKNVANSLQETPQYKTIETKKEEVQKEKEVKIASLPKPAAEPKKPEQAKKDKFTFNLDVDPKEYPELAVYKGVLFEVGNENKNFNKEMYNVTWDEAVIKEGSKKGENYFLTLKKASKKYELLVYPVFEGKNYETALKDYQDKFSKYSSVHDKQLAEEKRIEEEYNARLASLQKQQNEMQQKWEQEQAGLFKHTSSEEKVKRMFAINSFGVYNSDCARNYPQGVSCAANLTTDKNVKLQCYDVYLVDKARNGLFTFYKNPVTTFSFNPESVNMLWTTENGVLYWLKPEQFKDIKGSEGLSNLQMNRINQKFNTVDEVKTFFNL